MDYKNIKRVPNGHWNYHNNHILFIKYLAEQVVGLDITKQEDWYKLSTKQIREYGGNGLLNSKYEGRTIDFFISVFPNWKWHPWLFTSPLRNFWPNISTQKEYITWLRARKGWTDTKDCYKLTTAILCENNGSGLLIYYNSSIINIVSTLVGSPPMGDDEWYPWLFGGSTPNGYWKDIDNQRKYLDWLYKRLNFNQMKDWYSVSQDTFRENYGSGLVLSKIYNSSHIALLQNVYKEYIFHPWLFKQTPQGFWKAITNQKNYMKWLSDQLKCKVADDWYGISKRTIQMLSGGGLLGHYYADSCARMIINLNPHLSFDETCFNYRKTEAKLERWLREHKITYKKQYSICKGKKNGTFKIDFLLPELGIGLELDGSQHFKQVFVWLDPELQTRRDVYKMQKMSTNKIRCIRLLQEELYNADDTWLESNLLPYLEKSDSITPIYITTENENKEIYESHKILFADPTEIIFDALYL